MTTQKKKFIEPSDIIGLRVKCSHSECQAEIVLPIDKPLQSKRLAVCPICRQPWLREIDYSAEVAVDECVSAVKYLKDALKSKPWNFSLSLEIKDPEAE